MDRPLRLSLLAITLLAFGLRAYRLEAQSYWIDEAWTLFYAHQTLEELLVSLRTIRAAPPLYHLLTIYWVRLLGDGEYALRYLSLVFSVLTVPLTYRLGQTIGNRRLGLIAAGLVAIAPYQIWHAQDARNYSLLTAAVTLSLWSFFNLWHSGRWAWRFLYIFSTIVALFSHYHGLIIIGVQGLYFLLTWRQHWRYYLPWTAMLVVILAPLATWLLVGSTLWQSEHWLPLVSLGDSYLRNAVAFSVGELVPRPTALYLSAVFGLFYLLGLLYAAGVIRSTQTPSWGIGPRPNLFIFLLTFTLAPNLPIWLYGLFSTPVYLERYLIPIQIGFLLTVATGVLAVVDPLLTWRQPHRSRPGWLATSSLIYAAALLPLIAVPGWVLANHYTNSVYAKPDWRQVIRLIETFSLPGDAILMTGDGGEKLFEYYYRGDLPVYHDFNTPVPPPAQAEARLAEIAADHNRLWYVPYGVEIDGVLETWLAQHAYPAWQSWLGRKRLALVSLGRDAASTQPLQPSAAFPTDNGSLILEQISRPVEPTAAGDLLPLTLTWGTDTSLAGDYQLSLRLINPAGDVFVQSDWPPLAAGQPTSQWPVNQPLTDRRSLWLPPDLPPGDYLVQVVVYNPTTGTALGQPLTVDQVAVGPTSLIVPPQALSIPNVESRPLGLFRVVGYAAPETLQPGQEMWLWVYWQALQPPPADTTIRLRLTAAAGQTVDIDRPLFDEPEAFTGWLPGQVRRAVYHLPTSPRLDGAEATLSLSLLSPATDEVETDLSLTRLTLDTRPRTFEQPPITHPITATLGDPPILTLLGYDLEAVVANERLPLTNQPLTPASALNLTLYWQPLAEINTNYTVFIQLLDSDNQQIVAQVDRPPLVGEAPTTTWLPDEILTDAYGLELPADLPPGQYRLIAGLYDPATGQRLPVAERGDFVELRQVRVE